MSFNMFQDNGSDPSLLLFPDAAQPGQEMGLDMGSFGGQSFDPMSLVNTHDSLTTTVQPSDLLSPRIPSDAAFGSGNDLMDFGGPSKRLSDAPQSVASSMSPHLDGSATPLPQQLLMGVQQQQQQQHSGPGSPMFQHSVSPQQTFHVPQTMSPSQLTGNPDNDASGARGQNMPHNIYQQLLMNQQRRQMGEVDHAQARAQMQGQNQPQGQVHRMQSPMQSPMQSHIQTPQNNMQQNPGQNMHNMQNPAYMNQNQIHGQIPQQMSATARNPQPTDAQQADPQQAPQQNQQLNMTPQQMQQQLQLFLEHMSPHFGPQKLALIRQKTMEMSPAEQQTFMRKLVASMRRTQGQGQNGQSSQNGQNGQLNQQGQLGPSPTMAPGVNPSQTPPVQNARVQNAAGQSMMNQGMPMQSAQPMQPGAQNLPVRQSPLQNHTQLPNQSAAAAGSAPRPSEESRRQAQARTESFMRSLLQFMSNRRTPITGNPTVAGRKIHLFHFYGAVARLGGSSRVERDQMWPTVAMTLGYNLQEAPEAPRELAAAFGTLLQPFEEVLQAKSRSLNSAGPNGGASASTAETPGTPATANVPVPPSANAADLSRRPSLHTQSPSLTPSPALHNKSLPQAQSSRQSTPAAPSPSFSARRSSHPQGDSAPAAKRQSLSVEPMKPSEPEPLVQLPKDEQNFYLAEKRLVDSYGGYDIRVLASLGHDSENLRPEFPLPVELGLIDLHAITMSLKSFISAEVRQALDKLILISADARSYLKLDDCPGLLEALCDNANAFLDILETSRPRGLTTVAVDQHAHEPVSEKTTDVVEQVFDHYVGRMSYDKQSDLVIRVRSDSGRQVDTVDTVDVEALDAVKPEIMPAKGQGQAVKSTAPFGLPNYSDLVVAAKRENEQFNLQRSSNEFWDVAVYNRLVCVTTVLRNLSFTDENKILFCRDERCSRLFFRIVALLNDSEFDHIFPSTRRRLDLIKDMVSIFANVAACLVLTSAQDTLSLLLFVLSFSPAQLPYTPSGGLHFDEYIPNVHRYLTSAVDIIAKTLPRDPPNREFYQSVLLGTYTDADCQLLWARHLQGRQAYPMELLTRTFALVISTLPRFDYRSIPRALEIRRPLLLQSLLVAERLTEMIPEVGDNTDSESGSSSDNHNLALSWLQSSDNFAGLTLRAACGLGSVSSSAIINHPGRPADEANPFARFTQRCINLLAELERKALKPNADKTLRQLPQGIFPGVESLIGAMAADNMDRNVLLRLYSLSDEVSGAIEALAAGN